MMFNKVFKFNRNLKRLNFLSKSESFSSHSMPLDIRLTLPSLKNDSTNRPVVLLLGWLGCQDKHLQKYAKIYEDRGMATLRYTAPLDALFVWRSKMTGIAETILKTLEDQNLTKNPLLVHTFSNGGAFCFKYISDEIQKSQRSITIKGQVFDSGPCSTNNLGTFFHVMKEVIGRDKIYANLVATTIILGFAFLRLPQYLLQKYLTDVDPYKSLTEDPRKFPILLLYSKEDKLMPYKDVEKFGKHRKERGVDVKSNCFEGSAHVSHFVMHPDLYTKLLDEFLKTCLEEKGTKISNKL